MGMVLLSFTVQRLCIVTILVGLLHQAESIIFNEDEYKISELYPEDKQELPMGDSKRGKPHNVWFGPHGKKTQNVDYDYNIDPQMDNEEFMDLIMDIPLSMVQTKDNARNTPTAGTYTPRLGRKSTDGGNLKKITPRIRKRHQEILDRSGSEYFMKIFN
uniref:Uncharacterized protein n=1 Tax=Clastoptera arizonana TaxID=38151 RepID=A0A1B6E7X4_9HEMI